MVDRDILELLENGDSRKAFNEIIKSYSERLYWHVRSLVCCHEDADDLVQNIYIKVWNALPAFRGDSGLYTWLYRIATNEALNFLRKQRLRTALSLESMRDVLESRIESDPFFDGDEAERALSKALLKLPARQRAVFIMRYYDDMKYEDISEILGTSVGSLKASYHIAREKIENELKLSL